MYHMTWTVQVRADSHVMCPSPPAFMYFSSLTVILISAAVQLLGLSCLITAVTAAVLQRWSKHL